MNMPKIDFKPDAIALDLDGTLFNENSEISRRNRVAVETCLAMRIPIILATARPMRGYNRRVPHFLKSQCSSATINGAIGNGRGPLTGSFRTPIPEDIIREVLDITLKNFPDTRIFLEIEGYEFGANWTASDEFLWEVCAASPGMLIPIEDAIERQPSKIAISETEENVLEIKNLLTGFDDELSIVPSLKYDPVLNITEKQATKSNAIRRLLEPAGKSFEKVLAFGDDITDVDMLSACGFGIAMGNAHPEVKEQCHYSTGTNQEDGVAMVLETIPGFLSEGDRLQDIQMNLKNCM